MDVRLGTNYELKGDIVSDPKTCSKIGRGNKFENGRFLRATASFRHASKVARENRFQHGFGFASVKDRSIKQELPSLRSRAFRAGSWALFAADFQAKQPKQVAELWAVSASG